ncbi:MAG: phosphoethanolamine--lipid A transferase [Methylococcaceae bacterium]|nr:phosphoethanolamine--lipid A transferase [Methylococcaceae bacterium]
MSAYAKWLSPKLSLTTLVFLTALFLATVDNQAFLTAIFKVVDTSGLGSSHFKVAVFIALIALFSLLLSFFASKYVFKPIVILILILAAIISFFMDSYGVIVDVSMIQNIVETDSKEATELLSAHLVRHVVLVGLLPALCLYRIDIQYSSFFKELGTRCVLIILISTVLGGIVFTYYKDFALIDRNNRALRYFINPNYPIYALGKYIKRSLNPEVITITAIGKDAQQINTWKTRGKKSIVVVVVGETARAQNFSLNGYAQNTNPLLSQEAIINFPDTHSCGTATAESVPCMFSDFGRSDYSDSKAKHYENVLDVLTHAGINVLWRDNNSGCKGVCDRVTTESMEKLTVPEICNDKGCFDEILLQGLQEQIDKFSNDGVIVLHQKGSHGPAYYQRYPETFKKFMPECASNQVQDCPQQQIINAYDNSILYTDYFLTYLIHILQKNTDRYNTALLYMSDHGESLGEKGIYLHGLPYKFAPDEQIHIPFILWLSPEFATSFNIDTDCLAQHSGEEYSHDNLFHSLLGMLDVQTGEYDAELDIFNRCRR